MRATGLPVPPGLGPQQEHAGADDDRGARDEAIDLAAVMPAARTGNTNVPSRDDVAAPAAAGPLPPEPAGSPARVPRGVRRDRPARAARRLTTGVPACRRRAVRFLYIFPAYHTRQKGDGECGPALTQPARSGPSRKHEWNSTIAKVKEAAKSGGRMPLDTSNRFLQDHFPATCIPLVAFYKYCPCLHRLA
jgi:hypothetical protein